MSRIIIITVVRDQGRGGEDRLRERGGALGYLANFSSASVVSVGHVRADASGRNWGLKTVKKTQFARRNGFLISV